jgi:hypothetical protein
MAQVALQSNSLHTIMALSSGGFSLQAHIGICNPPLHIPTAHTHQLANTQHTQLVLQPPTPPLTCPPSSWPAPLVLRRLWPPRPSFLSQFKSLTEFSLSAGSITDPLERSAVVVPLLATLGELP